MRRVVAVLCLGLGMVAVIGGCGWRSQVTEVWDYYYESKMQLGDLNFVRKDLNSATPNALFFESELTVQEIADSMRQKEGVETTVYPWVLYEYDAEDVGPQSQQGSVLVSVHHRVGGVQYKAYFVIKEHYRSMAPNYSYMLQNCIAVVQMGGRDAVYFAPTVAVNPGGSGESPKDDVYFSWEEFAQFYTDTGKDNFVIDNETKTIVFECTRKSATQGKSSKLHGAPSAYLGKIKIHFVEGEESNSYWIEKG